MTVPRAPNGLDFALFKTVHIKYIYIYICIYSNSYDFSSLLRFFLNHSGFLYHIQLTHTVGLLWTSVQPVAEASTYTGQHNIETQETNIHALSGIRTRDPSDQATADLRLRPRDHRGRLSFNIEVG
jgi:hypothetical protein